MIKEVVGDLLTAREGIIAHQTNCVGAMGAGVAKQIKEKLLSKEAFLSYHQLCKEQGSRLLGKVQFLPCGHKVIANVFGEDVPGKGLDTDYHALYHGMKILRNMAVEHHADIAIPGYMGCGLAGGDWIKVMEEIMRPLFEKEKIQLTIYYYNQELKDKYEVESYQRAINKIFAEGLPEMITTWVTTLCYATPFCPEYVYDKLTRGEQEIIYRISIAWAEHLRELGSVADLIFGIYGNQTIKSFLVNGSRKLPGNQDKQIDRIVFLLYQSGEYIINNFSKLALYCLMQKHPDKFRLKLK